MRTEYLTESSSSEVALTEEQVTGLVELGRRFAKNNDVDTADDEGRSRIRCTSTGNGRYNVSVDNAVGIMAVGGVQFVVRPKISTEHLMYLLEIGEALPRNSFQGTRLSSGTNLIDLIAKWFIVSLERIFRDALVRGYEECHDQLPVVRGSLQPLETSRLYYSGVLQFFCRYEKFDIDNSLNRLLKAAAERLAINPTFSPERRKAARLFSRRFVGVGRLVQSDFVTKVDRLTSRYSAAAALAKLILKCQYCTIETGRERGFAFLLPTPHVVQTAITRILRDTIGDISGTVQRYFRVGSGLRVNPDLFFPAFNAVADVKYKSFERQWNRGDLYQVVAFAAAGGCGHAAILGFCDHLEQVPPTVRFGGVEVVALPWVAANGEHPANAAQRFSICVRRWLCSQGEPTVASAVTNRFASNAAV